MGVDLLLLLSFILHWELNYCSTYAGLICVGIYIVSMVGVAYNSYKVNRIQLKNIYMFVISHRAYIICYIKLIKCIVYNQPLM